MAEQFMATQDQATTLIENPDGTYSQVPCSTTADGQVVLALNEMGIDTDGNDMVVIAADENLDMATLENLLASGAVSTVTGEDGNEYLQLSLECLGCSGTFDSIYNLNKHTRSCRAVREITTKFRCIPCNHYVNDVASLKAHVKAHEGSQIISCPVCGERGFPGFNQLNHHITRAHALKVNRRHVCRYCESTFESKRELDGHIRNVHADERNARQSRGAVGRLKCRYNYCDFTTNSIMLLDRHHEQHRRKEEDGDEMVDLSQRVQGYPRKRRPRMPKQHAFNGLFAGVAMPDKTLDQSLDAEDVYVEDDGYVGPSEHSNITRRTITLIKAKKHGANDSSGFVQPLPFQNMDNISNGITSSRRQSRARRMPAWYKDYDTTDYPNQPSEEMPPIMRREDLQAQLPPGIELEDPMDVDKMDDIPTEEWNIVVYEDEEEEEESTSHMPQSPSQILPSVNNLLSTIPTVDDPVLAAAIADVGYEDEPGVSNAGA